MIGGDRIYPGSRPDEQPAIHPWPGPHGHLKEEQVLEERRHPYAPGVTGADRPFALEHALTLRVRDVTGWTTRETAEKCGLSQHTLRWYERIGLLDRVARTADATAMPTWTGSCC